MKKTIILYTIGFLVSLIFSYYFFFNNHNQEKHQQGLSYTESYDSVTKNKKADENSYKTYDVKLTSTLINGTEKINQQLDNFKMKLHFSNGIIQDGTVYDITTSETSDEIPIYLPFTYKYINGLFQEISLLDLSPDHKLNLLQTILNDFSYSTSTDEVVLNSDYMERRYIYNKNANQVTRKKIIVTDHNDNSDILNEHENWLLSLNDDGTPRDLTSYFYKEINFENERLKIEQEISIKQISNENILNTPFLIHSNAYLKTKTNNHLQNDEEFYINESNFNTSLVEFDNQPDLETAFYLGQYLAQQGSKFIKQLLMDEKTSDSLHSSIIFALERSKSVEAEYILAELAQDHSLAENDRLRAIMSISKMGETNSSNALLTLQSLLNDENLLIANTAMLNIGILGTQTEQLGEEVTNILKHALENTQDKYFTLSAIYNLKTDQLTDDVSAYINSAHPEERKLAAKILARNTPSVTKLIEQLSIEKNPTVINTITESLIQNQEIKLTQAQANLVKEKILQESVNSIIGLSYLKLFMKATAYNEENVSFIERLKSDHSLSEDTRNLITQWIENN
ncbi:HEAT repeat domain-containing protein [Vibrio cholerae]|uniref:HEAT repeat domain-containing protein n=1 Tax=Vibrio cholerae TaxID=666 RepID=UPI0011D5F9AD|nr:HEAT repeat domain-containing protein [Vibrio cholerae]TXX47086.1 HEAT repeat domain-containing protein [Vibrio cholerae]